MTNKVKKTLGNTLFILFFLFLVPTINALEAEEYTVKFYVVDDTIVLRNTINFEEPVNVNLTLFVPEDAHTIEAYADDQKVDFIIEERTLIIELKDQSSLRIEYLTQKYLDSAGFLASISPSLSSVLYEVSVILPEGAILKESIQEDDPLSGSFFPKDAQLTSDGKSLIFIWKYQNVTADDQFSYFIRYMEKTNYVPYFVIILLVVLIIFFVIVKKARSHKPKQEPEEEVKKEIISSKVIEKQYDVGKHLKEDEQSIVNILKQRDDQQIEQGTLRVITGFSKATLSRLLKELEERNVIYKEKRGKKNLIFLK